MEPTVHERDCLKQPLSKPELRELLGGRRRLFGLKGRQVECPLR